ncbi:hypothetical protein ACIGJO_32625 [Streptomyces sp. NPDC079020]|uniref:hypothetical protein n=1 Tax=Streptomyces sp. NPDC079020 TaxID=3365722 RepID=UPI0037D05E13
MSMHGFRRLTVLAALAALALPLGMSSAGASAPQQAAAAPGAVVAAPFPGAYISPWGDAQIALSDEAIDWMKREGITLDAIGPFAMDKDARGFSMPIGSTAGDGLDSRGRIFYPGGLNFRHAASGRTITLKPTYIRVMPTPAYSAAVLVDGVPFDDEVTIAESTYVEVMAGARPSLTGFRIKQAPFYMTEEASSIFRSVTGGEAPRVGSLFGTLTPNFDYVPTK